MKKMQSAVGLLGICLILLVVFAQYSLASDDAEDAGSEIDRILSDPEVESRGKFGLIGKDGEHRPYDWRVRWLKHFPKVSVGGAVWFNEGWEPEAGPTLYITAHQRKELRNTKHFKKWPYIFEYITPMSIEAGVAQMTGIVKFGWLILPIIDLKLDIGVAYQFDDNLLRDGLGPMIGISLLRL